VHIVSWMDDHSPPVAATATAAPASNEPSMARMATLGLVQYCLIFLRRDTETVYRVG